MVVAILTSSSKFINGACLPYTRLSSKKQFLVKNRNVPPLIVIWTFQKTLHRKGKKARYIANHSCCQLSSQIGHTKAFPLVSFEQRVNVASSIWRLLPRLHQLERLSTAFFYTLHFITIFSKLLECVGILPVYYQQRRCQNLADGVTSCLVCRRRFSSELLNAPGATTNIQLRIWRQARKPALLGCYGVCNSFLWHTLQVQSPFIKGWRSPR